MEDGPPDLIAIDHDDHAAQYIGQTGDGRQFILTTQFEPATDGLGAEYLALYCSTTRANCSTPRSRTSARGRRWTKPGGNSSATSGWRNSARAEKTGTQLVSKTS